MKHGKELNFRMVEALMLCCLLCGSGTMVGMIIGCYMKPHVVPADHEYPATTHMAHTSPVLPPPCPASTASSPALHEWIAPSQLMHSMTDEELMWRASMVPRIADYPHKIVPKVAFMFLTRGTIPLAPFWVKFFKGHDGLFTIYMHGPPSYGSEASDRSVFHGRRIPSQAVQWGRSSMLDAERRLLANALLDFSNQRFVLVSESCIPLFNFSTIYDYLMGSDRSFVGVFDDPTGAGRGRYNRRMWPDVRLSDWRKGSQWFEVDRKLAVEVVSDRKYYALFRDHCTPPCYVDEHYLPTLVNKHYGSVNANRSLTFVDWSWGGSHPATFGRKDMTVGLLRRMRSTDRCGKNLNPRSVCFLFARKISPTALRPLMRIGPLLMGFDP
ncbi:unnamed protein product [Victoria cruziana]